MNYTIGNYKTSLRNRVLNRNFMRKIELKQYSEGTSMQDDYNEMVENLLSENFQQTFDGCYDKEEVNPIKWCNDYTMTYNELLCEKFGQSYSPYTGTKKIAISHNMHPNGKVQAMVDFLRIYNYD